MYEYTWEEAVQWLRQQPDQTILVRDCYYDDPLLDAAKRFAVGEEWQAVQTFLPKQCGQALDLGAGRGISSYALAHNGWQVTALEPTSSSLVGVEAIHQLVKDSGLTIGIVKDYAETLPFKNNTFDLVHARQVLHHARDLFLLCREVSRVLKPGGRFIVTREPVISKYEDLQLFLDTHPLHRFYGGENAFLLKEYTSAISNSGLVILRMFGHLESVINYFPKDREQWRIECCKPLSRRLGHRVTNLFINEQHIVGKWILKQLSIWLSKLNNSPGRLYSFIAEKPLA